MTDLAKAFAQVHVKGSFSLVELEPPPYEPPEHRACREYADGELQAVMDANWHRGLWDSIPYDYNWEGK